MKNKLYITKDNYTQVLELIEQNKGGAWVVVMDDKEYKSNKQNSLFHSLLDIFWNSGCSSYDSYQELRLHYKDIAGLIKYEYNSGLEEHTRQCVWKCIKILKLNKVIPEQQFNRVCKLLNGEVQKELSWAYVSKKNAKYAIDTLINDMYKSGVNTKKFESIMLTIGEIW